MNVVSLGVSAGLDVGVVLVTTLLPLLGVATLMLLAWLAAPAMNFDARASKHRVGWLRPMPVTLLPSEAIRRPAGVRQPHPWELSGSCYGPTRAPPPTLTPSPGPRRARASDRPRRQL